MELALGAAAGGFATLAAHEVEGARGHGLIRGHGAESASEGPIGPPELLAEPGGFRLHLCLYIYHQTQTASTKFKKSEKQGGGSAGVVGGGKNCRAVSRGVKARGATEPGRRVGSF